LQDSQTIDESLRVEGDLIDAFVGLNLGIAKVCSEIAQSITDCFVPNRRLNSLRWEGKLKPKATALAKSGVDARGRPLLLFMDAYLRQASLASLLSMQK
jgi:hypothetical protein